MGDLAPNLASYSGLSPYVSGISFGILEILPEKVSLCAMSLYLGIFS
jgi:hypothetical protein